MNPIKQLLEMKYLPQDGRRTQNGRRMKFYAGTIFLYHECHLSDSETGSISFQPRHFHILE
jgi:hypothetical protein